MLVLSLSFDQSKGSTFDELRELKSHVISAEKGESLGMRLLYDLQASNVADLSLK